MNICIGLVTMKIASASAILIFIFPNILVDGDKWHIIDYEWTFEKHIDAKEIAFRAFYNYTLGGETRKACEELLMKDILGLQTSR